MKTQDELLQDIGAAIRQTQGYLSCASWTGWHVPLRTMIGMLEALEIRIRMFGLPLAGQKDEMPIGVYAVRNLDELDGGALSLTLCRLHNDIKACSD